jgi:hypothetical protein
MQRTLRTHQEDAAVTVRRLGRIALVGLTLLTGRLAFAGEPARLSPPAANPLPALVAENQKLANSIATQLRSSGQLRRYSVEVAVRNGDVELTGCVADVPQREEVLRLVQGVPGVVRVVDHMSLASGNITPVQAVPPAPVPPPPPAGDKRVLPSPTPAPNGAPPANGASNEPLPLFRAPIPGYHDLNPPAMPPYAWPTYAPYNNYSRVAYPQAYPYNAWPFIGPIYPFPKIPLGWRSVKLEWDDGYWWYGRVGCKYDWWKIRYW